MCILLSAREWVSRMGYHLLPTATTCYHLLPAQKVSKSVVFDGPYWRDALAFTNKSDQFLKTKFLQYLIVSWSTFVPGSERPMSGMPLLTPAKWNIQNQYILLHCHQTVMFWCHLRSTTLPDSTRQSELSDTSLRSSGLISVSLQEQVSRPVSCYTITRLPAVWHKTSLLQMLSCKLECPH